MAASLNHAGCSAGVSGQGDQGRFPAEIRYLLLAAGKLPPALPQGRQRHRYLDGVPRSDQSRGLPGASTPAVRRSHPSQSGVRLRASHVAGCMTPFRRFRPELDVLYLGQESVFRLELLRAPLRTQLPFTKRGGPEGRHFEAFMDILSRTKRYAVPVTLAVRDGYAAIVSLYLAYHAETAVSLSFVLPYSSPPDWGDRRPDRFVPPGKRCRLVAVPPAALDNDALVIRLEEFPWPVTTMK